MKQILIMLASTLCASCGTQQNKNNTREEKAVQQTRADVNMPSATEYVKSSLRNRIRLELNAPVSKVWAQVGKLERMPEYSSGLRKVETKYNNLGKCTAYTCYFLPIKEGEKEMTHSGIVKWYEPNIGIISLGEEPNAFGLQQSLQLIAFEPKGSNTILQWDNHYTCENNELLKNNIMGFEMALNNDIADNLIKKIGGRVLENYVDTIP